MAQGEHVYKYVNGEVDFFHIFKTVNYRLQNIMQQYYDRQMKRVSHHDIGRVLHLPE